MAKKVAGNPVLDATMPMVDLHLGGQTYHLAYTIGALSTAKQELLRRKITYNVLIGCDIRGLDIDTLPIMFWVGLIASHPEITLDDAKALITMQSYLAIADAVAGAYLKSVEPAKDDKAKNGEAE